MLIVLLALLQTGPGARLHVDVQNVRNDKGAVYCALYQDATAFPQKAEKALSSVKASIDRGSAACEFSNLAPGAYAVSVFHDENGNGRLDTNFMGVPKEGTGASNDAKGSMGPPKFDRARFDMDTHDKSMAIHVAY